MPHLNLGVVAHVDAGKTSLTERLLFAGGVIDTLGSVDAGSTRTDSLALERRRGITIKTAVASFPIGGVTVNLIDTPGHPDFIAEVERALRVLDGAVLVVSAVEGVQAQTRVLMRTLRRLRVPTLIFVNKIDRAGARTTSLLRELTSRLGPEVVAVSAAAHAGTPAATAGPVDDLAPLVDHLQNDELLAFFVRDERALRYDDVSAVVARRSRAASLYPVFFGSAVTGAGVGALMDGLVTLLPTGAGDPVGPLSATVFKVERDGTAHVRVFDGVLHVRDHVPVGRPAAVSEHHAASDPGPAAGFDPDSRRDPANARGPAGTRGRADRQLSVVTALAGADGTPRRSVSAGEIARVGGLRDVRIGDAVGLRHPRAAAQLFPPPTLSAVVEPRDPARRRALHAALTELSGQDPLINLRVERPSPAGSGAAELAVSLYGEVQKEVIESTLAEEYGIEVTFRPTRTILVERPAGTGAAGRTLGKDGNPYLATLDLTVEPGAAGSGMTFVLDVPIEQVPIHVFKTTEFFREALADAVRAALDPGPHGRQVIDARVTASRTGFTSPGTTAAHFRHLTPVVLHEALAAAGTLVCEPFHRFHLDIPADTLGPVLGALSRLGALPDPPTPAGDACEVEGVLPAARLRDLELALPALTRGEALLESAFDSHRPCRREDARQDEF